MELYSETKDPSELKEYTFDWSPYLADGEAVTGQTVTFVDAAGTANPSNQLVTNISQVWLSGGTHGQRAVWTIVAVTNGGRTLDLNSFGVDIIDTAIGIAPATTLERLQAHREKLLDAKDEAIGGTVVEVWNGRYGNKMKYNAMTYDQICAALVRVDREIAGEQRLAAGGSRRGAVGLIWEH